ncbi:TPA: hypothetical protein ACSP3M_004166, partial [Aeromonas veronii]
SHLGAVLGLTNGTRESLTGAWTTAGPFHGEKIYGLIVVNVFHVMPFFVTVTVNHYCHSDVK